MHPPPPPPTSPCSPTDHACTPLPGQDRPSRPSDLRSFLPGCFFTPCTVCTRAAAPPPIPPNPGVGLPSPPPPPPPWGPAAAPSQPSPPSPPHGAGAVVVGNKSSLSVVPWGCGRCLVLRVGGPAVTHWGPPGSLLPLLKPPPCSVCPCPEPAGSCWPGLSLRPRSALQMSVLSQEPRAVNYMVINL